MFQKTSATQTESVGQKSKLEEPTLIYVGIFSFHTLAAHYLVELVRRNLNMTAVVLSHDLESAHLFPPESAAVILIDLWDLPLPTGEYLETFGRAIPRCVFLALDRARDRTDIAQLLRAGFSGFISHDEALYLLGPAIEALAQHRIWTSPEVIDLYMNLTSQRTVFRGARVEMLTVRENQILDLLRRRYSNREIASFLDISESTVKFHVSNVLMKLNASNRRDLANTEPFDSKRMLFRAVS